MFYTFFTGFEIYMRITRLFIHNPAFLEIYIKSIGIILYIFSFFPQMYNAADSIPEIKETSMEDIHGSLDHNLLMRLINQP